MWSFHLSEILGALYIEKRAGPKKKLNDVPELKTLHTNNNSTDYKAQTVKKWFSAVESEIWLKHTFSNHTAARCAGDVLLMMMHIWAAYVYWATSQWCENIQTLSYWCPIFFSPFGSCQRSTSNSMRWNQALLSMSHWCITRPGRSRLCKHTLSRAIEDVGRWPHRWFTVYLQGRRVTRWQGAAVYPQWLSCCKWRGSSNQDRPGSASAPLSCTVWNDQWANIKWSQAKIGPLMKMDRLNMILGEEQERGGPPI